MAVDTNHQTAPSSTAARRLIVGAGGLAVSATIAGVFHRLDVSDSISTVIVPGVPGLLVVIDEVVTEHRQLTRDPRDALLGERFYRRALPLMITAVLVLIFLERLLLTLVGASAALLAWWAGEGRDALAFFALGSALSSLFAVFALAIAMIFVGRHMAHRLRKRALLWIQITVALFVVVDLAILVGIVAIFDFPYDGSRVTGVFCAMAFLSGLGGAVGFHWARKENRSYVMKRLFAHLPASDQRAVIELVTPPKRRPGE